MAPSSPFCNGAPTHQLASKQLFEALSPREKLSSMHIISHVPPGMGAESFYVKPLLRVRVSLTSFSRYIKLVAGNGTGSPSSCQSPQRNYWANFVIIVLRKLMLLLGPQSSDIRETCGTKNAVFANGMSLNNNRSRPCHFVHSGMQPYCALHCDGNSRTTGMARK